MLGLWVGTGGEGAKACTAILAELRIRGVEDVCIVACPGCGSRSDVGVGQARSSAVIAASAFLSGGDVVEPAVGDH